MTAPIRSAPPKCASCASSTTRRWRSPPSTRRGGSRARTRCSPACSSRCSRARASAAARSSRSWRSATAIALEAAIRKAADGQGEIAPVDAALDGPGERCGALLRHRGRGGGARPGGGDRLRARDHRAAQAGEPGRTSAEDGTGRPARRRHRARLQQRAVGAIMMATDFLLNAHKPTDPSFQDIMQIKQNANRAAALVRQLLAFSRRQTLRPQVLDLGESLSDLGHAAAAPDRREGRRSTSCTAATCGRSRSTSRSSSR